MKYIRNISFLSLLLFFSCRKDQPPVKETGNGSITTGKRLIICNEGNFGSGNADITIYDPLSGGSLPGAYSAANGGQLIGDVLQSGVRFNGRYYWVVNNSGKVIVTDNDLHKVVSVAGFISPRYIEFVSNNKAYVSNYLPSPNQPNYVQVLDINTNTVVKNIRLDGWTEQMVQSFGKVYVCNQRKKYVYVINAATDLVVDSIFVNATNACIVKDMDENLWVSCNADAVNNVPARLVRINPLTDSVEKDISLLTTQNSISRLVINGQENTLYYLLGDLYKMPVSGGLPGTVFVQQGSRVFYGLCVDPTDESIYIGDAIDYNQNGTILRYASDGSFVTSFRSGIIPGYMWVE